MNEYSDGLKVRDALQSYFAKYHFAEGGYRKKYFTIKLGPLYIPFPNIKARVDAVKIHDIHHIVTGYNADYKGEAEIGAWEIASGCGKYWVAWILNLGSFIIGMLFYQRALLQAFLDGRKVKNSLYYNTIYNDALLDQSVGELRNKIGIPSSEKNATYDYWMFALWCFISLVYHVAVIGAFIYITCKIF